MPSVSGMMKGRTFSVARSSPSTAESTEMAGVMTPSPYSSDAPAMPTAIIPPLAMPRDFASLGKASESSARMPPSPWLSARMTMARYFTETSVNMLQMMSESTPTISRSVLSPWCRHSLKA